MTDTTMYAWARPADLVGGPLTGHFDHCWVTTFKEEVNPVKQPDPPPGYCLPEFYWYCYGGVHNVARLELDSAPGSLNVADAISPPNVTALPPGSEFGSTSSTSGTIGLYGLDGVCQNVANQVLFSTGSATVEPARVKQANGYPLVTFFFFNYGLNIEDWEVLSQKVAPEVKMPEDDFLVFMKQVVPEDKQDKLLEIRLTAQTSIIALKTYVTSQKTPQNYHKELGAIVVSAIGFVDTLVGTKILFELFPGLNPKDTSWLRPEGFE